FVQVDIYFCGLGMPDNVRKGFADDLGNGMDALICQTSKGTANIHDQSSRRNAAETLGNFFELILQFYGIVNAEVQILDVAAQILNDVIKVLSCAPDLSIDFRSDDQRGTRDLQLESYGIDGLYNPVVEFHRNAIAFLDNRQFPQLVGEICILDSDCRMTSQ